MTRKRSRLEPTWTATPYSPTRTDTNRHGTCLFYFGELRPQDFCMAGGPGLEPAWTPGPGDPDYTVSARKHVVYTVSGPKSGLARAPLIDY
jgi:hypothetical protein